MTKEQNDAVIYLKLVYGVDPSDLDLTEGQFDIDEADRVAVKYGLTKRKDMTLAKARVVLASLGIKL